MDFFSSLGDLFPLRGSMRAATLASLPKVPRKGQRKAGAARGRRFGFEMIEPRLLLSADGVLTGFTGALTNGLDAVGTEIDQLLTGNPLLNKYVPGIVEARTVGEETRELSPTLGEALSISVDVGGTMSSTALAEIAALTTLEQRWDFIDELTGVAGNSSDELALRAMDINNDGQASLDEAFKVLFAGRLQSELNNALNIIVDVGDPGIDNVDLANHVEVIVETFDDLLGPLDFLADRLLLAVDDVSWTIRNDALTWDADFSIALVQRDRFDLGYEADKLGILPDPGTPPAANTNPFKVPVISTAEFGSLQFGFTGVDDGDVTDVNSEFFFAAPDRAADPNDGVRIGVSIGSTGDPVAPEVGGSFIAVNVGFLGAHFIDPNGGAAGEGGVLLDMDVEGKAVDPSNVSALGFTDTAITGTQGVAQAGGSVEADGVIQSSVIATTAIQFTLKVGNDAGNPGTELTLPPGAYANTAAILAALNTAIGGSALAGVASATDNDIDNMIEFRLVASDPTPLGFLAEQSSLGTLVASSDVSSLIGVGKSPFAVSFLLSVNNQVKLVTVNVTVDANGADNLSGIPFFPGFDADDDAITIDSLVSDLQAGLDAAGFSVAPTASNSGNTLRISGTGTVEISHTLTLDTIERITLAELTGPTQVFDMEVDGDATFSLDLRIKADAGLDDATGGGPVVVDGYRPEGTIKFTLDPFAANKVKGIVVDTIPGTNPAQPVVRASYLLTDAGGNPLKDGASDMQDLLDFNVINVADMLGTFSEIGTWFERLSGTDLLQGFDLPFADAVLGDLLNFKDLITDSFLLDDGDNGAKAATDDVTKLLQWVGATGKEKLVAVFGTAQQLESKLNGLLAPLDVKGTVLIDGAGRRNLTYDISIADIALDVLPNTPGAQPLVVPLDFEINLDPFASFETGGKLEITAKGGVGFTLGVILGNAVDALKLDVALDSTPLLSLNSEAGVKINTNWALTTFGAVTPLVGRLSGNASFDITVFDGNGTPGTGDDTITSYTVNVLKALDATNFPLIAQFTNDNKLLADLVGDINHSLSVAGLGTKIQAVAEPVQGSTASARILLVAIGPNITRFQTTVSTGNTAYTELGLRTQSASTVSLVAPLPVPDESPGADIAFTVTVFRTGVPAGVASPLTLTNASTFDNVSLQSLVNDLNAILPLGIVASQSGGTLVLSAIDSDIESFTVSDADALGLDLTAANDRLAALGVLTLPGALVGGVQFRAGAAPGDPFGRIAATADFTIDVGEGAKAVQVTADSTATNASTDDLVRSLNGAIEAQADLKGKIAAINDGGRIVLRAIAASVTGITVAGLSGDESTAFGLAGGSNGGPLAIRPALNAPVSYGVSSDVSFVVDINGVTQTATLTRDNTILNRSLYDLAASLNNAINAAVVGVNSNPLIATVQAGQIVIGLKTSGTSTNLIGDAGAVPDEGIAPNAVTGFKIYSSDAKVRDELKLVSALGLANANVASKVDFIIYFRDGTSASISLDALDTNTDQKLDATLFDLKNAIVDQSKRLDLSDRIQVEVNTDGTSLKLTDLTGGANLFRIIAVNGSPAAAQLGILGSDTSALSVGEVPVGALTPDGVIEGGKLANIDLRDRIYLTDAGASAELTVKSGADPLTAEATFGFVGVKLTHAANTELFKATAELPIVNGKLTLRELFDALGDSADLLALVGDPTLTLNADITFDVDTFPDATALLAGTGGATVALRTNTDGDDDAESITLTLADLNAPAGQFPDLGFIVVTSGFGDLLKFQDIEFDNVIQALQAIADFLKQFEAFEFLGDDIPVLGLSVNDLIGMADEFQVAVDEFQDNPAGGIQALAQKILEGLGLPNFTGGTALQQMQDYFRNIGVSEADIPPVLTQLIQFVIDGDILRFDMRLPVGFNRGLSVDLDLGEALGVSLGPVDIQGGANLAASGFFDARLAFGIDLTDPTRLVIYDDDTGVFAGLSASAQNVQFNAAIGPLGVFVKDGSIDLDLAAAVDVDNGSSDPIVIALVGLPVGDEVSLADFLGTLQASLSGSVAATLPIYVPTDSDYLGDLTFSAGFMLSVSDGLDLTAPSLSVPDLSAIDLSSLNPFNSIPQMLDALDFFLMGLQDIMDGEVFGIELPLIGDQLQGAADFIEDLRRDVLAPIRTYAEQAPELGLELVQKLLFSLLGSGSAGVLIDNPLNPGTDVDLSEFLGLASDFSGLDVLKEYDPAGDADNTVEVEDIVASNTGTENFQWLFRLGQTFRPSVDINFDLGIPAIAFDMDVGLDITIDWDLALGLGIGTTDGAYIFIGDHRAPGAADDDELTLSISVDIAQDSEILGSLGFLQLEISEGGDQPGYVDDPDLEHDGTGPAPAIPFDSLRNTFIAAQFGVDLKNSNDSADQRLSFSELGSLTAVVSIEAEAEVNLDITARFNPDILPDAISALLPEVSARFVLDWETGNILGSDFDFADSLTLLGFRDVEINMGSFINDFLGPFVEKIAEVTGPLQPIIDVITAPIPVISDLAGQPISLVDIAGMTGYVEPAMIYAIADIITLVNKIGGDDYGDFAIPLGDFMLIGGGSAPLSGASIMTPGYSLKGDNQFSADNLKLNYALPGFGDVGGGFATTLAGSPSEQKTKDLVSGLGSGTEGGSSGFAFPLFDDPSLIFGLLLGKDIPIVTYDLAPFGMDFSYTQKFPVWDALFVRIGGSVGLTIDLAFGYDTAGVREFAEGGFSNPLDLLGGLYVSDTDQATGEGTDVPELVLKGELFAGAELNLGIASAGAEGVIGLEVDFDLYDPDSDGKVRVDELLGNFLYEFNYGSPALAPIAIFDVTGEVTAQLRAFVEALFFKYEFEITPPITLFEFSIPFEREPFLATERGDGSLVLNIGPNSAQRLNGDTRDIDEVVFVRSLSDTEVEVWNGTTVRVGDAQRYKVNKDEGIFGYGGSGNDIVDLSLVTHSIVYLIEGGVGDDTLLGTAGGGSMMGGLGNDAMTGGSGIDYAYGGGGNDTIDGAGGNDFLFGDTGIVRALSDEGYDPDFDLNDIEDPFGDRIRSFVGEKDGDDHILGGAGLDIILGGGGNDWIEGGADADIVLGDGGNFDRQGGNLIRLDFNAANRFDVNARGAGGKDTIFGNAGNDVLFGGASDDLVDGGADNDEIDGGAGFDAVYGGSAADTIYGGGDADIIFGFRDVQGLFFGQPGEVADAAGDGIDIVFGEEGNDFIRGNGANDILHGGAGADILFGDQNDDQLFGEAGGDIMFGGADGDFVDGSDGADIAFGDDGLVVWINFSADNTVFEVIGSRMRYVDGNGDAVLDQLIGDGDKTLRDAYAASADLLATSRDLIVTTTLATDGNDTVVGGDGNDILFGGGSNGDGTTVNQDTLFGDFDPSMAFNGPRPNGQDIMVGDGGRVEMFGRRNARAASESGTEDGKDVMSGNDAGDFMFGGGYSDVMHGFQAAAGNTPLDGVEDNDVMLGDHGEILFNEAEIPNRIEIVRTTYAGPTDTGRSDQVFGTFGNDVMFGGLNGSSDVIEGGLGQDILLGDQGEIRFDLDDEDTDPILAGNQPNLDTLDLIRSYRDGLGGIDIVSGGQDADVLIGGTAGDEMYGDNALASSGAADGEDIMLGDNADVFLIGTTGRLTVKVAAMTTGTAVDLITTTDDGNLYGGADTMTGNAMADILFGGVFGDTIYGDAVSPVNALDGDDVLVGDNGLLDFTLPADTDRTTLDLVRSFRDGLGGADTLSGNAGSDIGIGGNDGDTIYGDNATAFGGSTDLGDVLLGDNADIFTAGAFNGAALLRVLGTGISLIKATDTAEGTGGIDTVSGNAGADVVIGGVAGDILYGDAAIPVNALDGNDVLLGDNGELAFGEDVATAAMFDLVSASQDLTTLDRITSFLDALGAIDIISGNAGADTALGGTAGDTIYGDNAPAGGAATDKGDILLGDNGELLFVNPGFDLLIPVSGGDRIVILGGAVASIKTRLDILATGGSDTISGNAGGDIVLGGVYGDTLYGDRADVTLTNGDDGNDILLGDNGAHEWLSAGRLVEITGVSVAAENLALAEGFTLRDANLDTLDLITTEQPNSGGRDLIFGDNGRDVIFGGTDADRLHGDSGDLDASTSTHGRDLIFGDHGRLYPQFSRAKSGNLAVPPIASPDIHSRNFFAIDIGQVSGGEGDEIWGEEGDDILLGQQGDDRMWGGLGNDDMIGGHNVRGGWDELGEPVAGFPAIDASLLGEAYNLFNVTMNDAMDGGSQNDTMAGDNAIIWRRADDLSPRFRVIDDGIGATTLDAMYTTTASTITTNVGAAPQSDPDDAIGRDITLLDHSDAVEGTPLGRFGNDIMAGGAQADVMFGQLGTDLMQGDGWIGSDDLNVATITRRIDHADSGGNPDTDSTLYFNIPEAVTDGDDYMEGNGAGDLMYGNLGQDDMIGGSSALYGLTSNEMRPDGADTMFGGAGVRIIRNDLGMANLSGTEGAGTSQSTNIVVVDAGGHARDADFMMGDNANVYRLVKGGASGTDPIDINDVFRTFAYDNYAGALRIVPRAMQQLDYTLGGSDFAGGTYNALGQAQPGAIADNGAPDLIHGEAGDDIIFGMTGSDVLFGEGQDDDIVGGYGHDWISGGTGQDGVLGDDGLIYTSRNSTTGEVLYGVAGLLASDADTRYSNGNALNELIATPGSLQTATINKSGELKKTVDLVPFSFDPAWIARDDEFPDNANTTPFADDIIFGGWGSDWLHGGSGDDAISGAEALVSAFVPTGYAFVNGDFLANGRIDLGYAAVGIANALVVNPTQQNPGNVLFFQSEDLDGQHLNNRYRAGEFELYDEYNPRQKLLLDVNGRASTTAVDGTANIGQFLLNFAKIEAVQRPGGTVPKATGQQTETYGPVADDGADAIFGDLGNDWLVGGTGRDNIYGGWGNDLLQADDNLDTETTGVPAPYDNESPDTHPTYEDRAYGGAGRDVLIGNTGGDRLIDWVGEYNSYLVPYAPFGQASVSRTLQPFLPEYLYALSSGDGADPTRYIDVNGVGSIVPQPTGNNPNPSRNGEPSGELGLVLQKDFAWGDQTGAPADPQAGNIPGGPRDVLRSADFAGNNANGFVAASGTWTVANNAYEVAPASSSTNKDAISLFNSDVTVPGYFEITASINAIKPVSGFKANAYIIFDYYSPTDFKFAGINISTNKIEIGQRAAWGFQVLASQNMLLKADIVYNVLVAINGSGVTFVVNNVQSVSYAFAPRVDSDGFTYGISAGMYGLGADNAKARIDNVMVQRIPPKVTLTATDAFSGAASTLLTPYGAGWSLQSGRFIGTPAAGTPFAIASNDIAVRASSMLKLDATLSTSGVGGIVFDLYSPNDFKWVAVSKATNQVLIGHYTAKSGWVVDAAVARTIAAGDSTLSVTLRGTTVNVSLNGQLVLSRIYNGNVVDGGVGLFSRSAATSFDSFTLQTDDPKFAPPPAALMATVAPPQAATSVNSAPTSAEIAAAVAEAKRRWEATGVAAAALADLEHLTVQVANLDGLALGQHVGDAIIIDADAAGYGWFIDRTLGDDREYTPDAGVLWAAHGPAADKMDLLSVVAHELGHAVGLLHADDGVMDDTLRAGQRSMPQSWHDAQGSALDGAATGAPAAPALAIDWSVSTPLARPRDAGMLDARLGDLDWRRRFVNHMGASREAVNPNAALRLYIPVASQGASRVVVR